MHPPCGQEGADAGGEARRPGPLGKTGGVTRPVDLPPSQATSSSDPVSRPSRFGRGDERIAQRGPPAEVGLPPSLTFRAEALPTGVDDVETGGAVAQVDKRQLHIGGVGAGTIDMPPVPESMRRLPQGDLAPFDFRAVGGAFENPAAWTRFKRDDGVRIPRGGMTFGPPA